VTESDFAHLFVENVDGHPVVTELQFIYPVTGNAVVVVLFSCSQYRSSDEYEPLIQSTLARYIDVGRNTITPGLRCER